MQLPAALKPWHRWLHWFDAALAIEIGQLVSRLHPLLGAPRGDDTTSALEPDGLDDLRRRGSYERLLASEWLLADEVPEEFLRRAANGEHLFTTPRLRARHVERNVVALFDAGPQQFGAPRLVQLALWILLARRAATAHGRLQWGIVQVPGELRGAEDAAELQKLLGARDYLPAATDHWQAWQAALAALPLRNAEYWLASSRLELAPGFGRQQHEVSARLALEDGMIDVTVGSRPTRPGLRPAVRNLTVPLPASAAAVRLLRGQFVEPPKADTKPVQDLPKIALSHAPVISPDGSRIAVPLLDHGGMLVVSVPKQRGAGTHRPRVQRWAGGGEVLALAFGGRGLGALIHKQDRLHFWQMQRFYEMARPPREKFAATAGTARWLPAAWARRSAEERLYVLDQNSRLAFWQGAGPNTGRCKPGHTHFAANGVLAITATSSGTLVYVRRGERRLELVKLDLTGQETGPYALCEAPPDTRVFFAGGDMWQGQFGGCAVLVENRESGARWRIFGNSRRSHEPLQPSDVELAPGWDAVGMLYEAARQRYVLVTLSPCRTRVRLRAEDDGDPLVDTAAPVQRITVCPSSGLIALLTEDRHLIAWSGAKRVELLHLNLGEGQHANA